MSNEPQVASPHSLAQPSDKRSGAEGIKENSRHLRGTIALTLAATPTTSTTPTRTSSSSTAAISKRTATPARTAAKGLGKHYMFMVRCKIPGGRLTAEQYLAVDDLAGKYANGTLRFTSRQGIQLHGVLKGTCKETIAGINALPADHARGLRRREPQRHGPAGPARTTASTPSCRRRRPARRAPRPAHAAPITKSGSTASPSLGTSGRAPTSSRSTARSICRASSRSGWRCPRTTASTSTPRIWACWPSSRTARSSATTCWSAAAWA